MSCTLVAEAIIGNMDSIIASKMGDRERKREREREREGERHRETERERGIEGESEHARA